MLTPAAFGLTNGSKWGCALPRLSIPINLIKTPGEKLERAVICHGPAAKLTVGYFRFFNDDLIGL